MNCPDAEHTGYREDGNNVESPKTYGAADLKGRDIEPDGNKKGKRPVLERFPFFVPIRVIYQP